MNRRTLLRGSLAVGTGVATGTLAACDAPAAPGAPSVSPSAPAVGSTSRRLLAYFSRAGENYFYGGRRFLDVGNTHVVAEMISSIADVDVYRIEAAEPYPTGYEATVQRNTREQDAEARPAIAGPPPPVADYDVVLLGSPIWNVRPPMIMRTFLEGVDTSGKTILPFVTYAVSGLGSTVDDYTRLSPQAEIGEPLAVRGEEVRQARPQIERWLAATNLVD